MISLSTLCPKFPFGNKYGKASSLQKLSLRIHLYCFSSPGALLSSSEVGEFDIIIVSCEINLSKSKGFWSSSKQSDLSSVLSFSFSADSDNKSLGILSNTISIPLYNASFCGRYS